MAIVLTKIETITATDSYHVHDCKVAEAIPTNMNNVYHCIKNIAKLFLPIYSINASTFILRLSHRTK